MLISIDSQGMDQIEPLMERPVKGQQRYYYVGSEDSIPVILVSIGSRPQTGELWEASSGNEIGYSGFCRPAHTGVKIGKLTLRYKVNRNRLDPESVIRELYQQIQFFINNFSVE